MRDFKIYGDCPDGIGMIRETLLRLPDEVQSFAATRCRFFYVDVPGMPGGAYSHADCAIEPSDRFALYLLTFVGAREHYHGAGLVQELAMAYAGCRPNRDGVTDDEVNRAAEQAAAWGFDGPGVEYIER